MTQHRIKISTEKYGVTRTFDAPASFAPPTLTRPSLRLLSMVSLFN